MIVDFIDYYEDNYIGHRIRNNRGRPPRFSISMWNIYARLDQQLPRTNNSSESWHKAIQVILIHNVFSSYNIFLFCVALCSFTSINITINKGFRNGAARYFNYGGTVTIWFNETPTSCQIRNAR